MTIVIIEIPEVVKTDLLCLTPNQSAAGLILGASLFLRQGWESTEPHTQCAVIAERSRRIRRLLFFLHPAQCRVAHVSGSPATGLSRWGECLASETWEPNPPTPLRLQHRNRTVILSGEKSPLFTPHQSARKWVPHPWRVFVFAPRVGKHEPHMQCAVILRDRTESKDLRLPCGALKGQAFKSRLSEAEGCHKPAERELEGYGLQPVHKLTHPKQKIKERGASRAQIHILRVRISACTGPQLLLE